MLVNTAGIVHHSITVNNNAFPLNSSNSLLGCRIISAVGLFKSWYRGRLDDSRPCVAGLWLMDSRYYQCASCVDLSVDVLTGRAKRAVVKLLLRGKPLQPNLHPGRPCFHSTMGWDFYLTSQDLCSELECG